MKEREGFLLSKKRRQTQTSDYGDYGDSETYEKKYLEKKGIDVEGDEGNDEDDEYKVEKTGLSYCQENYTGCSSRINATYCQETGELRKVPKFILRPLQRDYTTEKDVWMMLEKNAMGLFGFFHETTSEEMKKHLREGWKVHNYFTTKIATISKQFQEIGDDDVSFKNGEELVDLFDMGLEGYDDPVEIDSDEDEDEDEDENQEDEKNKESYFHPQYGEDLNHYSTFETTTNPFSSKNNERDKKRKRKRGQRKRKGQNHDLKVTSEGSYLPSKPLPPKPERKKTVKTIQKEQAREEKRLARLQKEEEAEKAKIVAAESTEKIRKKRTTSKPKKEKSTPLPKQPKVNNNPPPRKRLRKCDI